MPAKIPSKGTWYQRFGIHVFTFVFGLLVFWLLGFLVEDIEQIPGPDYKEIRKSFVDKSLDEKAETLKTQVKDLEQQISNQNEKQKVLGDGSRNLQQTINQLVELQKLGMQKSLPTNETQQANMTSSLKLFLENQKKYQEQSQILTGMVERKQSVQREKEVIEADIEAHERPARKEQERLEKTHRLWLAFYQLAILLPILALAAGVLLRFRGSIYYPLFLAFGAATLVKVGLVIHEYFPSRYVRYILIGSLLLVVARLLVYLVRAVAFPKARWLLTQFREAYERFLCPVCEFPIRTGPRRFLFWTRSSVAKLRINTNPNDQEEAYACPSCGTTLFEECAHCHKVRHSMLPNCSHCGTAKEVV